jgi:hypothetical protein
MPQQLSRLWRTREFPIFAPENTYLICGIAVAAIFGVFSSKQNIKCKIPTTLE